MDADAVIARSVARLAGVPGIVGIVLGGSRATGTADETSDIDLGLLYRAEAPPARDELRAAAAELDDEHRGDAVTELGAWGPWIDGGAWLTVDGLRVDWLFRDVDAVAAIVEACRAGRVSSDYQPGHPHAFHSHIWFGEIREAVVLHDPAGTIAALKSRAAAYPPALRAAVIERFGWEARFALETAITAAARGDVAYVAGCVFRSVACLVQVCFALNERSFRNEKGAVAAVDAMPAHPVAFRARVEELLAAPGGEPAALAATLAALRDLVEETVSLADAALPSHRGAEPEVDR